MAGSMAQGAKEFGRGLFEGVTGVVMQVNRDCMAGSFTSSRWTWTRCLLHIYIYIYCIYYISI